MSLRILAGRCTQCGRRATDRLSGRDRLKEVDEDKPGYSVHVDEVTGLCNRCTKQAKQIIDGYEDIEDELKTGIKEANDVVLWLNDVNDVAKAIRAQRFIKKQDYA